MHLFGSVAASLSICNNNDIDVCLELSTVGDDSVSNTLKLVVQAGSDKAQQRSVWWLLATKPDHLLFLAAVPF